jgi:uncharacterized GH25 family protein
METRRLSLRLASVGAVVAALALARGAAAHDFWIEPSTYRPAAGQRVTVRLRVGNDFLGDALARDESLLVRFATLSAAGEGRVPGVHGRDPAGIALAPESGTMVVAYESSGTLAELTPEKMAVYVEQEGIAPQLPRGWQAKKLVRDRFSRSVKSLLVAGGDSSGFDRVAALPFELVPLADPARVPPSGGTLALRLLWQGKPAPGIHVAALSRLDPRRLVTATTDAGGQVTLALPRGGEWLVKAVRVLPAKDPEADIESVWTSLTFLAGGL